MRIKDDHVFCCGKDLGVYNRDSVYWCDSCGSLIFTKKTTNLMKFIREEK